uniref:Serine-threonine/tyrosine-protein kinase catalytic domain-containing protein n=1 Tax=Panagrolaimus superbus TaxID=310955 RepID=A0A914YRY5_9BILA
MRPEQCPLELYTVMLWCWDEKPIDRPNFDAIKDDIKAVHSHIKLYEAEKLNITVEATGYEIPNASK